jgi:hypothetical protein
LGFLPNQVSHWLSDKKVQRQRNFTRIDKKEFQERLVDPLGHKEFMLPALNSTRNLVSSIEAMSPLGGASRRSTHDILLAVSGRTGGKPLIGTSTKIKQNTTNNDASKVIQQIKRIGQLRNTNSSVKELHAGLERITLKD